MKEKQSINSSKLLSTRQVAERLGIKNYDYINTMIKNGRFPNAFKTGKEWRIPIRDIEFHELNMNKTTGCLNVKNTAKRLGYEKHKILSLLKKSKFPNAFKHLHEWWIPEEDILSIENERLQTLDVSQLYDKFNFSSFNYTTSLINRGVFPNAYKDHAGRWRVPLEDVEEYSKKFYDNTLSTTEVGKMINESRREVNRLIKDMVFPNSYLFDGVWKIPMSDINKFVEMKRSSLNIKQATSYLKLDTQHSILTLIEKNLLPNAFKYRGEWRLLLGDLEQLEKVITSSLNTIQTAIRLQLNSGQRVTEMIHRGVFPNAFKDFLSKWRIPLEDIEAYKEKTNIENHVDVMEASKTLGYKSSSTIKRFLSEGRLPRAIKHQRKWWIHKDDLKDIQDEIATNSNSTEKNNHMNSKKVPLKEDSKLEEYLSIPEIQKELKINRHHAKELITKGVFSNSVKYRGRWWVHKASFSNYLNEKEKLNKIKQNALSVHQTAKILGYASAASIVNLIIKDNKFPNAFKVGVHWYIPEEDIIKFDEKRMKAKKKITYSPIVAFTELKSFIESIEINDNLLQTRELFTQYCLLQINNMGGSDAYKKGRVQSYMILYKGLAEELSDEIFLVPTNEIEEILHEKSSFKKNQKKILIPFLRYVYNKKDMDPDIEFSLVSTNKRTNTQEIYSPDQFHKIYQYVKDVKLHISHAVSNRHHANMWVYTILLLTDFIRGQDLIMHTPSIDLKATKVKSIDWFLENKLSEHEIQLIINQLYLHFRNKRTGKTDELLTFIIAPDLVKSLAYALAISEMHRKTVKNEMLLGTFIEGIYSNVITSGRTRHKKFFNFMHESSNFKFSSLKMNRTVATYLFYSITEEEGEDSDLALHLSRVSRSHKKDDSTSRYIQSTNKDGSINRVSFNLFKRGHFGWLYNYLLLYVTQFENTQDTLEERSRLIEKVRKDVTPNHIENMGEFVHNSLNALDVKDNSSDMEAFMQNIYSKRQTVISKLRNFSKEEVREIIVNLAKGNLPSKNENAQCLVYPECKNPKLSSCFSCEYVIPGNLMLIQLNEELKRLVSSIKDLTNEMLIKRDSMFLMHALLIWKEARIAFGDEKVNAYIPMKETWEEIETIAGKLSIEL